MAQSNGHAPAAHGIEDVRKALENAGINGKLDVAAPRPRRHSGHKRGEDADKQSFMLPGGSTSRPPSPDLPSAPPSPHSFIPLLRLLTTNPSAFTISHVRSAFHHMATEGGCTGAQVGAFLTALKLSAKDRESEVVAACADVMRKLAISVDLRAPGACAADGEWVCDIVGTGGDGHDTYNVSTTAAIVAAGAGARVCKHGNRASSSASGSADLLSSLNVPVTTLPPEEVADIGHQSRFLFLYAPLHHPSMALVGAIRRELGFPTIFNTLGPLINPARPDAMVLGVHSAYLGPIFAEALRLLGIKRAWVVCGEEGLDEISPEGATNVWEVYQGRMTKHVLTPVTFGLPSHSLASVKGGSPAANAATLRQLLSGEMDEASPIATWVVMNAAALLVVSGKAKDCPEGVRMARESIKNGKALAALETFGRVSREVIADLDSESP